MDFLGYLAFLLSVIGAVVIQEAAQPFKFANLRGLIRLGGRVGKWDQIVQALVIPSMAKKFHVLIHSAKQRVFAEEYEVVEILALDSLDEAFGVAILLGAVGLDGKEFHSGLFDDVDESRRLLRFVVEDVVGPPKSDPLLME